MLNFVSKETLNLDAETRITIFTKLLIQSLLNTVNYPPPKGSGLPLNSLPDKVFRNGYYVRQVMTPSVDALDRRSVVWF